MQHELCIVSDEENIESRMENRQRRKMRDCNCDFDCDCFVCSEKQN